MSEHDAIVCSTDVPSVSVSCYFNHFPFELEVSSSSRQHAAAQRSGMQLAHLLETFLRILLLYLGAVRFETNRWKTLTFQGDRPLWEVPSKYM